MDPFTLILILAVVLIVLEGFGLFTLPQPYKNILLVVVVILIVFWLLSYVGVVNFRRG